MANGSSISEFKERVMDAITHDDTIFYAFDAKDCENGGDLIDTHIFTYNKIPNTITESNVYMTIMVHTKSRGRYGDPFVIPSLEIWIYCHDGCMKMDRKITRDNRCDYMSRLLEEMFNGSTKFGGTGELRTALNTEGAYNNGFLYRHLIFETIDINKSMCN